MMEAYALLKKNMLRNAAPESVIIEKLKEDPRKKKKKKKKKNDQDEMFISFKPLGKSRLKDTKDSKNIKIPNEDEFCADCPVKFYDIQIEAVRWFYWIEASKKNEISVGGILADVMGLGKTIDCLGLIMYDYFLVKKNEIFDTKPEMPTLVVTTLALVTQWRKEAMVKFGIPENHIFIYHGAKRIREFENMSECGNDPIIMITNYETVQKDWEDKSGPIFGTKWKRCFFDEAHYARNPKSNTYHAIKEIISIAKWCVTGTPIVNYPDDTRMLSHLCTPAVPLNYGSSFQESRWKSLYLLRRGKENIPDLTRLKKKDVWLKMSDQEKDRYSALENWVGTVYNKLEGQGALGSEYQQVLLLLTRLRQACNHIYLQKGYQFTSEILEKVKQKYNVIDAFSKKSDRKRAMTEDDGMAFNGKSQKKSKSDNFDTEIDLDKNKLCLDCPETVLNDSIENNTVLDLDCDQDLENNELDPLQDIDGFDPLHDVISSSKIDYLKIKVKKILDSNSESKVVIFTQFRTMLDMMECGFVAAGFKTLRYDGKRKTAARTEIIELFDTDSTYRIILISLKVGGVGLNLVSADKLFLVDPWWNSSVEQQAFDRVHRIGQKRPVTVYRLLIEGSIEEEVLKIQKKKMGHENSFYDVYPSQKTLSIRDIHCVFNTIRVRQSKTNKQ